MLQHRFHVSTCPWYVWYASGILAFLFALASPESANLSSESNDPQKIFFVRNFFLARSHKYPVSSCGRAPDCSAGGRGFEPQTGPTLRVLKK